MKKIMRVLAAFSLLLTMSVQALAAPSIVGSLDMPNVFSDQGNATLTPITDGMYDSKLQAQVDSLNNAKPSMSVKDAFGDHMKDIGAIPMYDSNGKKISVEDEDMSQYKFLSPVMDLKVDGATPSSDNPVKVTFTVNNLTDDIEVYVMYYCEEHGRWELVPTEKVSDNQVSAFFHATSPVVLVYKDKAAGTEGGTSPKTGESSRSAGYGMAAVLLAAFGVYAVKKSRKAA